MEHQPSASKSAIPQTTRIKESTRVKSTPRTPQLTSLLSTEPKTETHSSNGIKETELTESFSAEQLREAWDAYAEQRKKFQAEYQMLSQPYTFENNVVIVELLSPVHETMLNNVKSELTGFLRERLRNSTLQVAGQLHTGEEKKVIYTNREKFDFLAEKNPVLKELRDRLGLDTDF